MNLSQLCPYLFVANKYERWYASICARAKSRGLKKPKRGKPGYVYYERHHILPASLGGPDDPDNLVLLTAREHFIVHRLLPRMCFHICDRLDLNWAIIKLSDKCKQTSRSYDAEKRRVSAEGRSQKHSDNLRTCDCKRFTGGEHTEKAKAAIGDAFRGANHYNAETWIFTKPNGDEITVVGGLNAFCENNNLSMKALWNRIDQGPVVKNKAWRKITPALLNTIGWSLSRASVQQLGQAA